MEREQIKTVETKVSKGIAVLYKTKDVLDIEPLRMLYQSLVEPCILVEKGITPYKSYDFCYVSSDSPIMELYYIVLSLPLCIVLFSPYYVVYSCAVVVK